MSEQLDGYVLYMMSERELYIKPLWQIQHQQRMEDLRAQLEYNESPDCIAPTWASDELAFAMWQAKERHKNKSQKKSLLGRLHLWLCNRL